MWNQSPPVVYIDTVLAVTIWEPFGTIHNVADVFCFQLFYWRIMEIKNVIVATS